MKNKRITSNNVLIASEYFHPHWTGIAKTFYYIAKNIQEQNACVTVLTTQFDLSTPLQEKFEGIEIIRSPFQLRLSRTHYSFTIIWKFLKILPSFDTVIINSPNSNILFFSLITKIYRKKLIIYHQGDLKLPRLTGNTIVNKIVEVIFDMLTIPSLLLADTTSSFTRDYAENSRVMKYFLYKFKAYVPRFTLPTGEPQVAFKKKLDGLGGKYILVGFAGRFVEEKAFDILLQAIPLVLKKMGSTSHSKRLPIHFVFAGKHIIDYEPYYEFVKPLIDNNKNHVTFLGLLDGGDYRYFYESISAFVLSSRSDCLAITQVEAGLAGVPVVVTDIPGARMFVKTTGFGEIVPAESAEGLADGIVKVLTHRDSYVTKENTKKIEDFLEKYAEFPL